MHKLMHALLAILLIPLVAAQPADVSAALADRANYSAADHPYLFYLSAAEVEESARLDLALATRLMVASSSRQPILERCLPQPVGDWAYRIDLRDLHWDHAQWAQVLKKYPYNRPSHALPLVVRADWLLAQLSDQQESDAYQRLLYGANVPKTRDDALKALGVDTASGTATPDYRNFGMIEGDSKVAVNKVRWIENRPVTRGYAWGTRDVTTVETGKDPLENLTGDFKHDGEEWIIGIPKTSTKTGARGALQVYFLANGAGELVARAPVDLVVDSARFRGLTEIRSPGSCIVCHSTGLNPVSEKNELRELLDSGVQAHALLKEVPAQLEAFHLAELDNEIKRNCEDFATAVTAVTGEEPDAAAAAFKRAIERFDAPLDLESTARELGVTADRWRDALAYASANGIALSARLAGLPHGRTITREAWEEQFHAAQEYLRHWEN